MDLDQPLSFEKREQNFGSTFSKGGFPKVGGNYFFSKYESNA